MKKIVKSILARHTERVTSQMKDLFEIIETYRKIHGIDPLTGQVRLFQFYFFFKIISSSTYIKLLRSTMKKQKKRKECQTLDRSFHPCQDSKDDLFLWSIRKVESKKETYPVFSV